MIEDDSRTSIGTRRSGRVYIDATCMLIFGIVMLAGSSKTDSPTLVVLVGLAAIGYAIYIAFFASRYIMSTIVYAVVIIASIWVLNGGSLN